MKEYLSKIAKYNSWANELTTLSLRDQNITDDSVLKLLSHIVLSEQIWMIRLKSGDYSGMNFWKTLRLAECNRLWQENAKAYSDFINSKLEPEFENLFSYKNSKGIEYSNSIEDVLTHVFIHSSYHRAQIAKEVRRLGKEPAYTDYIQFIRETRKV